VLTTFLLVLAVITAPATATSAGAQTVDGGPAPATRAEPAVPTSYRLTGTRLGVAQSIHVGADEEIRDGVVVVGGSLRVDGRVHDGVVVVGGDLRLGPTAEVRGDIVLVGGTLIRDPGARIDGGVSQVSLGQWWRDLGVTAWWPRLTTGDAGRWLGLAATTVRLVLLVLFVGLMLAIARTPVARIGRAAAAAPLRAAAVGLAAEVMFLPVLLAFSIALGITVIGLPIVAVVVPLAVLTAVVAFLLGFTALACRLGEWVEDRLGWRPRSAYLAAAIGMALIMLPTLLARVLGVAPEPVRVTAVVLITAGIAVEFLVWTIGLGATLLTGFGRWNLAPPPLDGRA
jgi:hypothetical protein